MWFKLAMQRMWKSITGNKVTQKISGDSVVQPTQVGNAGLVIVNNGITESRAREICAEYASSAVKEYSVEAYKVIDDRINRFADMVLLKIHNDAERLQRFSDPGVQKTLRSAQVSAATAEKESDFELLSELLVKRLDEKDNRKNIAAVNKAIEVIGEIDLDALLALTLLHVLNVFPVHGYSARQWFRELDNLYGKYPLAKLPSGREWIDHLKLLGLVEDISFSMRGTYTDYLKSLVPNLFVKGFLVGSEEYQKAQYVLQDPSLEHILLVPNDLLPNYVRIPYQNGEKDDSEKRGLVTQLFETNGKKVFFNVQLPEDSAKKARDVKALYYTGQGNKQGDQVLNARIIADFISGYSNVKTIEQWYDSSPKEALRLTLLGRVVAQVNAKIHDRSMPTVPGLPI